MQADKLMHDYDYREENKGTAALPLPCFLPFAALFAHMATGHCIQPEHTCLALQ